MSRVWRCCGLVVALVFACEACSSTRHHDRDTELLSRLPSSVPVVDYSTWPLGRIERALDGPACSHSVPDQLMFRNLTPAAAQRHGFGMIDALIGVTKAGAAAPADCPFAANDAESDAYDTALSLFKDKPIAKQVYAEYGRCMRLAGIDGAGTPFNAEDLVIRRYGATLDEVQAKAHARSVSSDLALPALPPVKKFEVKVAVASVECQASAIAPHVKDLIREQHEVIDSAPAKYRRLLR